MSEPHVPGPTPRIRRGATLILIVGGVLAGMLLATCAFRAFGEEEPVPETVTVVRPTADVIVAVRDLARLEGAEYHVERVIDLEDRQQRFFGLVQAEDAILLVAAGDVTAGVDLAQMRDGDVVVDPDAHSATLTLPPPQIFSTRLDSDRTFVHSRTTDVLARRSETLETRARQEAERTLREAALEGGILERAQQNVEQTIRVLVTSLGYDHVEIRRQED